MSLDARKRGDLVKRQKEQRREREKEQEKEKEKHKAKPEGVISQIRKVLERIWRRELFHTRLFLKRSTKPGRKEYQQLLRAHTVGILLLGFLGYFVTFLHIPIKHILFGVKE